ncbi:MAG: hypothetical protein ABW101_11250 [Candidatus Thiodiazotropha sp.]
MSYRFLFVMALLPCFTLSAEEIHPQPPSATAETETSLMPTYGNWCGRDHPHDPENAQAPIDRLDEICRNHDLCYIEKGHMACECDSQFNREIVSGLHEHRFTGSTKLLAHTFRAYFRGSPCVGSSKDKLAPTRVLSAVVKGADRNAERLLHRIQSISGHPESENTPEQSHTQDRE